MSIQSFTIQKNTLSWNSLIRKNHWTCTKIVNEWKEATAYALLEAKIEPVRSFPISLAFDIKWKKKIRRDVDSVFLKAIVDTLVSRKIIPDDSVKYVYYVTVKGEIGAERDELIVTIIDKL